jgi:hypothetical protein
MQIFNRSKPRDVLFLMPVRMKNEKPNGSKVRMLYCDARGKVYASPISRAVYEAACANTSEMRNRHRPFATVGIETSPGDFLPTVVEINERELWALEHISRHALKTGKLPDILKKHLRKIIMTGAVRRNTVLSSFGSNKVKSGTYGTSKVLNRLPYYRERDMELSMPMYKAEYKYPLIILKFLPNKNGGKSQRNLLILDSDGDLAVIKVPTGLVSGVEKELAKKNGLNRYVYSVIYQQSRSRKIDYMMVNKTQQKALNTIVKYYEETGRGKRVAPAAIRTIINIAEKRTIPEVH